MKSLNNVNLSMLDLVAVREGGTVADALKIAVRTAQHAEKLGFTRYWLAEHHNMPGIAALLRLCWWVISPVRRKRFAWARAASCCPTMHRWSWPRPLARWLSYTPAVSTWVWAARPAPMAPPCAPCAVTG